MSKLRIILPLFLAYFLYLQHTFSDLPNKKIDATNLSPSAIKKYQKGQTVNKDVQDLNHYVVTLTDSESKKSIKKIFRKNYIDIIGEGERFIIFSLKKNLQNTLKRKEFFDMLEKKSYVIEIKKDIPVYHHKDEDCPKEGCPPDQGVLDKKKAKVIKKIVAKVKKPRLKKCHLNKHCKGNQNPLWAPLQTGTDFAENIIKNTIKDKKIAASKLKDKVATVAVLDTGFNTSDQKSGLDVASFSAHKGFKKSGDPNKDEQGHGTSVNGIIGAKKTGITRYVNLRSYRVTKKGPQGRTTSAVLAAAIEKACEKSDIVNISWGSSLSEKGEEDITKSLWYEKALKKGCLIITSAGNSGVKQKKKGYFQPINSPHLSISASNLFSTESAFSSQGEISAPGAGVYTLKTHRPKGLIALMTNNPIKDCISNKNYYGKTSGTSFASPFTAGIASQVLTILKMKNILPSKPLNKLALIKSILVASGRWSQQLGSKWPVANALIAAKIAKSLTKEKIADILQPLKQGTYVNHHANMYKDFDLLESLLKNGPLKKDFYKFKKDYLKNRGDKDPTKIQKVIKDFKDIIIKNPKLTVAQKKKAQEVLEKRLTSYSKIKKMPGVRKQIVSKLLAHGKEEIKKEKICTKNELPGDCNNLSLLIKKDKCKKVQKCTRKLRYRSLLCIPPLKHIQKKLFKALTYHDEVELRFQAIARAPEGTFSNQQMKQVFTQMWKLNLRPEGHIINEDKALNLIEFFQNKGLVFENVEELFQQMLLSNAFKITFIIKNLIGKNYKNGGDENIYKRMAKVFGRFPPETQKNILKKLMSIKYKKGYKHSKMFVFPATLDDAKLGFLYALNYHKKYLPTSTLPILKKQIKKVGELLLKGKLKVSNQLLHAGSAHVLELMVSDIPNVKKRIMDTVRRRGYRVPPSMLLLALRSKKYFDETYRKKTFKEICQYIPMNRFLKRMEVLMSMVKKIMKTGTTEDFKILAQCLSKAPSIRFGRMGEYEIIPAKKEEATKKQKEFFKDLDVTIKIMSGYFKFIKDYLKDPLKYKALKKDGFEMGAMLHIQGLFNNPLLTKDQKEKLAKHFSKDFLEVFALCRNIDKRGDHNKNIKKEVSFHTRMFVEFMLDNYKALVRGEDQREKFYIVSKTYYDHGYNLDGDLYEKNEKRYHKLHKEIEKKIKKIKGITSSDPKNLRFVLKSFESVVSDISSNAYTKLVRLKPKIKDIKPHIIKGIKAGKRPYYKLAIVLSSDKETKEILSEKLLSEIKDPSRRSDIYWMVRDLANGNPNAIPRTLEILHKLDGKLDRHPGPKTRDFVKFLISYLNKKVLSKKKR